MEDHHDPAKLPPGEFWTNPCPVTGCPTILQNGRHGIERHLDVVHGKRARPDGTLQTQAQSLNTLYDTKTTRT